MDTSQIIALVVGYAFGSIPFGLLLTRLAGTGDIRAIGSGNIGATNVLRTGRKGLAAGTLLGDALKGTAAVLLMKWFGGNDAGLIASALTPVLLAFLVGGKAALLFAALTALVWFMHRANIQRLLRGAEPKIGQSKAATPEA